MSGLKRALFGEKGTPSRVVDTTPDAFANLRGPLASALLGQLQQGPAQFQGPFVAPLTGGEIQGLQGVQRAAGQVGQSPLAMQMLAGSAGMNPFAQLSGLEQFGLGQVAQQAFGQNPLLSQAQSFLSQQLAGQMNPFARAVGLSEAEQQGLNAIQQAAFGQNPLLSTVQQGIQQLAGSGGVHPQLDQLIQAATRPILEQFDDEALRQRGLFTAAGQQVQGLGSSPFAQASARLSSSIANALGDTTAQLTAALNQQQQQAQLQALGLGAQLPGMQLQNMLAAQQALGLPREIEQLGLGLQSQAFQQMQQNQFGAAGLADQLQSNALQRALAGLGAAGIGQQRQAQAFENQQNRQLQAGAQLGQQQLANQVAQLEAQLRNLQAQGLPRLVQQLGIDAGLQEFQRQQAQLMQLMQLMAGVSVPSTTVLPGTAGSTGALGAFAGGFGEALGTGLGSVLLSDRRMKRDIEYIGTTAGGTKLYRFRYAWSEEPKLGVMADEVAHIPGAVMVDDITGLATVDLAKVVAHG